MARRKAQPVCCACASPEHKPPRAAQARLVKRARLSARHRGVFVRRRAALRVWPLLPGAEAPGAHLGRRARGNDPAPAGSKPGATEPRRTQGADERKLAPPPGSGRPPCGRHAFPSPPHHASQLLAGDHSIPRRSPDATREHGSRNRARGAPQPHRRRELPRAGDGMDASPKRPPRSSRITTPREAPLGGTRFMRL